MFYISDSEASKWSLVFCESETLWQHCKNVADWLDIRLKCSEEIAKISELDLKEILTVRL